jgi:hypothetical protein
MKLKESTLDKLAEMICGNIPFAHFQYRSSSYLTKFFTDIDLEYKHDGSTRSVWVSGVLKELNNKESKNNNLPSKEICSVIENLVDPNKFLFDEKLNIDKAREDVKKILKLYDLKLKILSNGEAKVVNTKGEYVSTDNENEAIPERVLTFCPTVFRIPEKEMNPKLISVMMPFNPGFRGTYDAIKRTTDYLEFECLRADDIWVNTTFIQDIFELIYCSRIVVVDYSGRNPNVMYETGIAHTLGKTVIPITQSLDDIPSDLGHHRALKYLPNDEGYRNLSNELYKRIKTILGIKGKK